MAINSASLLFTGSTGLIGSHTLLSFCQKGIKVRALVKPGSNYRERLLTVFSWYSPHSEKLIENVEFFEGDITDLPSLENAFHGITAVIHCAALVSVKKSDRKALYKINQEGTANMVNLALANSIEWFAHVSSVASLGPNPEGLVDEDYFWKSSPDKTEYAISKNAAELEVWRGVEEGLKAVIINPSFVIGPSVRASGSSQVIDAVKKGLPFYVEGASGYVDVRDVSATILGLYQKSNIGERFIVSSQNLSTSQFLQIIAKALKVKPPSKEATPFMIRMFLLYTRVTSALTGKSSPITAAGIRMAKSRNKYDNSRLTTLLGLKYYSVEEAISNALGKQEIVLPKNS